MNSTRSFESQNTARVLGTIGQVLIGVYALNMLATSMPFALLDSDWELRAASTIQSGAGFPLVGTSLLLIARKLAPKDELLQQRTTIVQRLAPWVAIGFLLLIPLQISASIRSLGQISAQEQRGLRNLTGIVKSIENASTESELKNAIALLPGGPNQLNGTIEGSAREAGKKLANELYPQTKQLETKLADANRARWIKTLQNWVRDLPSSLLYAFGFYAISSGRHFQKINSL